ncbi:MAG: ATP-dependent transcriptional regulator, MalT-like, LuxR family [Mycobacterium sp.]|nr:ATP-dependent transcriptional regulator, MalT-like, LuxR family [Mycobacterium sp.]
MGPLLETKLHAPRSRQGAVSRPRLSERLGRSARSRLTVVSAPAGFGKTTLLTQWLADVAEGGTTAAAWVSLDTRDNDPATFWTYVITSLQTAAGDSLGTAALELLQPQQPPEAALSTLLNDLEALPREVVLVLDDYHVIVAQDIHDAIGYLLDNLPPQVHLVLATRVDPPLALSRLRARGELVEVRSADLRFTLDEAASYLSGPMGLTLTSADIAILANRTEGWAAALQLAGLSLQDRDDPGAVVAKFAGDDRFIVDYLTDEVLARLSDDVRDFLLSTSILDRLTGPLCDAVTGRSGGASQLLALERANLFLVPLDDRRQWFRYHHLFADVLRAHLAEQPAARISELHLRAADWFQANGEIGEAVRHALAAKDFSRAADLMELAIPVVARERREAELGGWVLALPDELLQLRPVLAVAFVGSLAQASKFDTVGERLTAIDASLRPHGGAWPERPPPGLIVVDETGYRAVPATIELYRAALALSCGDLGDTVVHAREALSLSPPEGGLVRAAAGALGGLASWTVGDLAGAHAAYTESVRGLASVGYVADVLGCTITVGDIERTHGRLGQALRTYRDALDLATPEAGGTPLRGAADMHVGMAGVLLERNDLTAAAEQLAASERLGEHNGLPQHPYRSRVVAARLRQAEGDLDAALELLEEADRVYNGDYSPNVQPVPALRARLRLRRGELSQAQQWAREQQLTAGDELSYLREYEHVTLARLLLAQHQALGDAAALDAATSLLHRLLSAGEAGSRGGTVIEILVLLALAQQAQADLPAALATLRRALTLGEPEGYARIFAEEGPPMAALLKAVTKQEPAIAAYARRLLAATTRTADPVSGRQTGLIEPLSSRELDVLRLLVTDLDGPDIARQLHVSLNTMRTHSRSIFRKLQVNNRRAAVRQALELDLLPKR